MKSKIKQLASNNSRGVLSLLAGNTTARIVTTVGGLVLANYYGAESYGVFSVFLSYILIISILSSLRIDSMIALLRDTKQIINLFNGALLTILAANFAIVSIISLLKYFGIIQLDLSYYLLLLIGFGSTLTAWNLSQFFLFTKYKLYKQISFSFALSAIISVLFQTLFYFINNEENGLIYGWMIGLLASFIFNARVTKNRLKKVDYQLFKQSIHENIKVLKYTYPSDTINTIANNIMPILILAYFTTAEVGIYAMAFKILTMPLVLLANAFGGVFYPKAASLYQRDNKALKKLTYNTILINVALITLFVIAMNTIGIYLLELFLKEGWEDLRSYILALSFWIIARSLWSSISDLDAVLRKNHYSLVFNIYLLLVNFIGIYYGVLKQDFIYSAWTFSILSGIGYIGLTSFVLYKLRKLD